MVSALTNSHIFKYNFQKELIQLRVRPQKVVIRVKNFKEKDLESLEKFNSLIISKNIGEDESIIYTDKEANAISILDHLKTLNFEVQIEEENIKEKVLNSNIRLSGQIPRKFSEEREDNKNIFNPKLTSSAKRKSTNDSNNKAHKYSYNKFDGKQDRKSSTGFNPFYTNKTNQFKEFPKNCYYSFKEITNLFSLMKANNKFALPKDWENTDYKDMVSQNPRDQLDHFKQLEVDKKQENYRQRAYTEVYQQSKQYFNS